MSNYKAQYESSMSFDISKTDEELGEHWDDDSCHDYWVFKTFGEAKKYLKKCVMAGRSDLEMALYSINMFKKSTTQ